MKRVFKYQITEEWKSIREFLLDKRYPHAVFVKLKKTENSVLVNGEWLHLYQPLHIGDRLEIRLEENTGSENIVARSFEDIVKSLKAKGSLPMDETEKLPIVYEDEDILIVNKPAGLPIHPSQNHYDDSLANAVIDYYKRQGETFVFRCINRLDRNTSGLTLIAKNMLSSAILSQDVTSRDIHRTYLALVENRKISCDLESVGDCLSYSILDDDGCIEAPIGRVEGSTIMREVNYEQGDYALTRYWKIGDYGEFSLIKLQLGTGRTHQIRVHMSSIDHPLLGDDLYGNGTFHYYDSSMQKRALNRHALHSYRLEFVHPVTRKPMDVRAELPEDLQFIVSGGLVQINCTKSNES